MDELNNLTTKSQQLTKQELIDEVLDLLILAYVNGNAAANLDIDGNFPFSKTRLSDTVYHLVDGKDFAVRLREYDDQNEIKRVIETETHRCYNAGIEEVAEESKANKTWVTMLDEKVREQHQFLEGVTVPYNEYFYTTDGDKALFPGGFETAANNVNCRCEVILSKDEDV